MRESTMTHLNDAEHLTDPTLKDELIALLIGQHRRQTRPALQRLWDYYRNELDFDAGDEHRPYTAAQARGLPHRLRRPDAWQAGRRPADRELVIENDIAWRIQALVDFMFGKPVKLESQADDPALARTIERVLTACFDANGGVSFYQDMALLGAVYGWVDLLLRVDRLPAAAASASTSSDGSAMGNPSADRVPSKAESLRRAMRYASSMMIETVEAPRAVPLLNPSDYRRLDAYVLDYVQPLPAVERGGFLNRLLHDDGAPAGRQATAQINEIWTDRLVRHYRDGRLIDESVNPLGRLPVVHIQNLPQPFCYEGLSEVEPVIPLQDELNTRLSDRANRVTFQSFRMYLGKGIEGFLERPVAPGQMWTTDNPDAAIETFGGDAASPSEDAHIEQIREALDKASAVTPLASGLLRNKVGHLTSENALRVTMMGLLARTEKKRVTYGQGIERLCELILAALDLAGVLRTGPEDRQVRLHWPSPLPENTTQRLKEAEMKLRLGVPPQHVLAELGYEAEGADEGRPREPGTPPIPAKAAPKTPRP